jgi:hypothetical protein
VTVLDRIELGGIRSFDAWLHGWRERWLSGERISVLIALDYSHAIVVVDRGGRGSTS